MHTRRTFKHYQVVYIRGHIFLVFVCAYSLCVFLSLSFHLKECTQNIHSRQTRRSKFERIVYIHTNKVSTNCGKISHGTYASNEASHFSAVATSHCLRAA